MLTTVQSSPGEALPQKSPLLSSVYRPSLDGLRGIAILSVMLYHFSGGYKGRNSVLRVWGLIADCGWMGVDLFFVLSGFLITGVLLDTATHENRIKNFFARRALRIFPLFYGTLTVFLLTTPIFHFRWQAGHILYFIYMANMVTWLTPKLQPIAEGFSFGHLWSLAVEEQFYMLWPFVVWWIRDRRILLRITVVFLLATPVLRGLLMWRGVSDAIISVLLITRADSLLIGGALALLLRGPFANSLPGTRVFVISLVALILVLAYAHGPHTSVLAVATAGYTLIAICSASLVYLAQLDAHWVSTIFNRAFLRFFGRYSYGLYVYHGFFFVYIRHLSGSIQEHVQSSAMAQVLAFLFGFGLSVLLAVLSYRLVEAPILKLKRRFV